MGTHQQSKACGEFLPAEGNPCRSRGHLGFSSKLLLVLLVSVLLGVAVVKGLGAEIPAHRGEFGGDLTFLASSCSGPEHEKETNFYLDMWAGRQMARIARLNGFTNNHALFINSHGRGGLGVWGNRYGFYPHKSLMSSNAGEPAFSIRDIAKMLGSEQVRTIHNVVISSCDLERCFSVLEVRKCFPNATNIIHTPAGQAGYQPMFYSALVNPSTHVEPLYEREMKEASGKLVFEIDSIPAKGAKKLSPFLADLFVPGSYKPFRTQIAGRELLESPQSYLLLSQRRSKDTASP